MTSCSERVAPSQCFLIHSIPSAKELHVYGGLSRSKTSDNILSGFWTFQLESETWSQDTGKQQTSPASRTLHQLSNTPCPRYAHQIVVDNINETFYLFGGNIGRGSRANDFWRLNLFRHDTTSIVAKLHRLILHQQYRELCAAEKFEEAIGLLRQELAPLYDLTTESEAQEYHELTQFLFVTPESFSQFRSRYQLYEDLLTYFEKGIQQPEQNLLEMVDK